jgi:hypothetical protein
MKEVVIDFQYLSGRRDEIIVKELSLAAEDVIQTFHFESPYEMEPHGSETYALSWNDGHIPYYTLHTFVDEAVTGYPHLCCYGLEKCNFINKLLGRSVHNLEDLKCPSPTHLKHRCTCNIRSRKFPKVSCGTKNAYSVYIWLTYHFRKRSYVRCPKVITRHTAMFVSGV